MLLLGRNSRCPLLLRVAPFIPLLPLSWGHDVYSRVILRMTDFPILLDESSGISNLSCEPFNSGHNCRVAWLLAFPFASFRYWRYRRGTLHTCDDWPAFHSLHGSKSTTWFAFSHCHLHVPDWVIFWSSRSFSFSRVRTLTCELTLLISGRHLYIIDTS